MLNWLVCSLKSTVAAFVWFPPKTPRAGSTQETYLRGFQFNRAKKLNWFKTNSCVSGHSNTANNVYVHTLIVFLGLAL